MATKRKEDMSSTYLGQMLLTRRWNTEGLLNSMLEIIESWPCVIEKLPKQWTILLRLVCSTWLYMSVGATKRSDLLSHCLATHAEMSSSRARQIAYK